MNPDYLICFMYIYCDCTIIKIKKRIQKIMKPKTKTAFTTDILNYASLNLIKKARLR